MPLLMEHHLSSIITKQTCGNRKKKHPAYWYCTATATVEYGNRRTTSVGNKLRLISKSDWHGKVVSSRFKESLDHDKSSRAEWYLVSKKSTTRLASLSHGRRASITPVPDVSPESIYAFARTPACQSCRLVTSMTPGVPDPNPW